MLGVLFDLLFSCDDVLCEKFDVWYFVYVCGCYEGVWGFKQGDNLYVVQSQYYDIGIVKCFGIIICWIECWYGMKDLGGIIEFEYIVFDYYFYMLVQLVDVVEVGK